MSRTVNTSDPIKKFWGSVEFSLNENSFNFILAEMVRDVRQSIDGTSQTAKCIDRKEPISEIAKCAQKDGLNDFAEALRFAEP